MKQFKKLGAFLLVLTLILTACGGNGQSEQPKDTSEPAESSVAESAESTSASEESETSSEEATPAQAGPVEMDDNSLYLITDLGTLDDKSFNQGSYEGMKQYADEIGVKANYIRPAGEGDQNYYQAVNQAVLAGAKVIVTPGFLFEKAIGQMQSEHPEVNFLAVDFQPTVETEEGSGEFVPEVAPNTVSILFKEEQSGYLAGYAAVKDGNTKLGFMGGVSVPAVIRFGFGYIAGANQAAEEMGKKVEMKYTYTGSFVAKPEIQTQAASWFKDGTEVIFSCGGGIAASVLKSAQDNGGLMIGVDVDQKDMGEEVLTSAMKNLSKSVYDAVKSVADGTFEGGKTLNLGVEAEGVQISDDFSRFESFTEDEYNALYEKLVSNTDDVLDTIPGYDPAADPEAEAVGPDTIIDRYPNVTLDYIQ